MSDAPSQLETIATLLRAETTLALATADENGQPFVAPLFYLVDQDLTLYWLSSASAAHSLNLARSSQAAVTVYRHAESWKEICGVQMRGQATAITARDRRRALLKRYRERFQLGAIFRLAISQCTLYAFRPESFRYLDNSRHFGTRFEVFRGQS